MSQDDQAPPHRSGKKCAQCGLVNAGTDDSCRRCGALLADDDPAEPRAEPTVVETDAAPKRSFIRRVVWILGVTLAVLVLWYASLLVSSDGLQPDQREKVQNAIAVLQQAGFDREVFVLNHLTAFRRTDSWWNRWVRHHDAYAATNFPFEVVTLYPEFFDHPVDDNERAAVLLHEASHLMGSSEDAALEYTWRNKHRLGWTADQYKLTRVWIATEQLTRPRFPYMFTCGTDGRSDCF